MTDPDDIRGWQRLSADVTTSGKLTADDPQRLSELGVLHVINLALDDHPEALADEAGLMAQEGVAYTHIPIPFNEPTREHYAAFKQALEAQPGPVHVHCIMNWRVSALFYLLHREQGMPRDEALSIMRQQWDPLSPQTPNAAPWAALITRLEAFPTGP